MWFCFRKGAEGTEVEMIALPTTSNKDNKTTP